jgi:hypothetical protein
MLQNLKQSLQYPATYMVKPEKGSCVGINYPHPGKLFRDET